MIRPTLQPGQGRRNTGLTGRAPSPAVCIQKLRYSAVYGAAVQKKPFEERMTPVDVVDVVDVFYCYA